MAQMLPALVIDARPLASEYIENRGPSEHPRSTDHEDANAHSLDDLDEILNVVAEGHGEASSVPWLASNHEPPPNPGNSGLFLSCRIIGRRLS
jgi:hypothetical protein